MRIGAVDVDEQCNNACLDSSPSGGAKVTNLDLLTLWLLFGEVERFLSELDLWRVLELG